MRIVIIEGIDRVGKTTLVNKLVKKYNAINYKTEWLYDITLKTSAEKIETILNFLEILEKELPKDRVMILDRFHLTEVVYGKIDRGYDTLIFDYVNKRLSFFKSDITLVLVNSEDIDKSIEYHGNNLRNHDILFKNLYKEYPLKKIETSFSNLDKIVLWEE